MNSSDQELNIVMTNEDEFHKFPLIVSHSNYKLFHLPKVKTKGYVFDNEVESHVYGKLLKQLDIPHVMCNVFHLAISGHPPITIEKTVTSALVNQLRKETGQALMTCKHALTHAEGDLELAKQMLTFVGTHRFHTCR